MRVLIISGTRQAQNIANRLLAKDEYRMMFRSAEHKVTFIEEDEALCRHLEQRFNSPIFQGSGTKKDLLEQVGVDNIDVVIAASEVDGDNVIAALQARQLGWKQVIAIVQEPEYAELLEKNDVRSISAPWATAAMVENLLDRPALAQLFEFGIGDIYAGHALIVQRRLPGRIQRPGSFALRHLGEALTPFFFRISNTWRPTKNEGFIWFLNSC